MCLPPKATLDHVAGRSLKRGFDARAESQGEFRKNAMGGRIDRRRLPVQQEAVKIKRDTIESLA